jgi:superfamily II RNA helicase
VKEPIPFPHQQNESELDPLDQPLSIPITSPSTLTMDDAFDHFLEWTLDKGIELYPAQEEAVIEVMSDRHVILNTPTGSGKSLVGQAAHFWALLQGKRSIYTSPIKALVNEKFFSLCRQFGPENVGMLTGDASINRDALILCCTQEILATLAVSEGDSGYIHYAIVDEFHYYGDRDRGMAWQIPLLALTETRFLLMSATLGDTSDLQTQLEDQT